MGSWRDMAADILARQQPQSSAPAQPDVNVVPSDIANGIVRLATMRPPRVTSLEAWAEIVSDAERLVQEGWVTKALALGWTRGDIFGVGPHDSSEFEGLAVWLRLRKLILLDADVAVALDGKQRVYFKRGGMGRGIQPTIEPVLLWQFGRR